MSVIVDRWDREKAFAGARRFLTKQTVGAILRGFAARPEDVSARTEQLLETAAILQRLQHHEAKKSVARVDIWVAADTSRKDHDCGLLAQALRVEIDARGMKDVFVNVIEHGDIFCALLNLAVYKNRCTHSLVLSSEANSNINNDSYARLINAHTEGARVAGLGFAALMPLVLNGHIMNTCALWDGESLAHAGGLNVMCAQKRLDDPTRVQIPAWKGQPYTYDVSGVEEVPTLLTMRNYFGHLGPFIAPIPGNGIWVRPDPANDPEGAKRFEAKLGTKLIRMLGWAREMRLDLSVIWEMVMPEYRIKGVHGNKIF